MRREELWRIVRDVYGPIARTYGLRNSTLRRAFDRSYGWYGGTYVEAFKSRFEPELRRIVAEAQEEQRRMVARQQKQEELRAQGRMRWEDMCERRRNGETLRSIAQVYSITPERVRQILARHDALHPSPEAIQRKKDAARFRHRQRETERRKRVSA